MFRRYQNQRTRVRSFSRLKGKRQGARLFTRKRFTLERLEDRHMFSTTPWVSQGPAPAFNSPGVAVPPNSQVSGAIQAVAANPTNPNILYVGAVNGGVWRTTDATSASPDWTPLTDSLPSQSIASLSLDPTDPSSKTLVAGTGVRSDFGDGDDQVGLYYTTNGGDNWIQFNQSILQGKAFYGVAARGNVIMAGAIGPDDADGNPTGGLYRSVDGGANWALVTDANGLEAGNIFDLVGDPLNSNRFYVAVEGQGVFRSDDAGATWTNANGLPGGEGINGVDTATNIRIAARGDIVYVGVIDDQGMLSTITRSANKGDLWAKMLAVPPTNPNGNGDLSLAADPNNPNVVYVGGDSIDSSPYTASIWRGDASLAPGSQFTKIVDAGGGNTSPHAGSRYLGFDATGNLLEGDDGGIYRRTNPAGSGSWGSVVGDLAVTEVHDVAWDSSSHTALVGTVDNGTIQQRTPAGSTTWDVLSGGTGNDVAIDNVTLAASNRSIRYLSDSAGNLMRQVVDVNNNVISTTNLSLTVDPEVISTMALNAIDPRRLVLVDDGILFESTNQGNSFTALAFPDDVVDAPIGPIVYGGSRGGVPNPDLIYVAVGDTIYKRTTAGGALVATGSFSFFLPPGFGPPVTDIAVDPNDWHIVYATDYSHVYKSTNAGQSWSDVTGNLTSIGGAAGAVGTGISSENFRSLAFVHGDLNNAIVVGTASGVYVSHPQDDGNWEAVGTGLPNVLVYDLEYNVQDNVLVAGTLGRGVWTLSNAAADLNPVAPTDLFGLHSLPGATKKIYLDFTGGVTTGTHWNTSANQPTIFTPPFDLDSDPLTYDGEQSTIRQVWAQVSELFRPFDVDVTTEDPGLAGIIKSDPGDQEYGVRILVGGSTFDWYQPDNGLNPIIGRVASNSFGSATDTPAFVFSADIAEFAKFGFDITRYVSFAVAWDAGFTLGADNTGQFYSYVNITTDQSPNDDAFVTVHYANDFGGFGRTDDYLTPDQQQNLVPIDFTQMPPAPLYTLTHDIYDDFPGYVGNKYWSPYSSWGPIMGNGAATLLQWSKGEYFNADSTQDELAAIASQVGYRPDDHGDTIATADPLDVDSAKSDAETIVSTGSGIIGEHPADGISDVDSFTFTVDGMGQAVSLDIDPFINGAALDVLAKIYSADGTLIATSNPLTELKAGSSTLFSTYYSRSNAGERIPDGGWRVQVDQPTQTDPYTGDISGVVSMNPAPNGTWTQVSKLILKPGTYYVTVEGTGKAVTYLDETDDEWLVAQQDPLAEPRTGTYDSALHPGPVYRLLNDGSKPKTAVGYYEDAPDPNDPTKTVKKFILAPLPEDNSDYGYSNYGSLGSYNVTVTQVKDAVVGVDFDVAGGAAPTNWNSYSGGGASGQLTGLISELGTSVPYTLSVTSSTGSVPAANVSFITPGSVPTHANPIDQLGGYISAQNSTTTYTWGGLDAYSYYTVYVFGGADFAARNHILITGGNLNGTIQTFTIDQTIPANGLVVNSGVSTSKDLSSYALRVLSDGNGQIKIDVSSPAGFSSAIAGLAIAPTRTIGLPQNGSISGQKWNDQNGNKVKDATEPGVDGFIIYIDTNNNGILDTTTTNGTPDTTVTASSADTPQAIPDQNSSGIKSSIDIADAGTIQDISVSLDITHTYDADLHVTLISPLGTRVKLFANVGLSGDNFHNTVFKDSATQSISSASATAPFTGTYRPQESLLSKLLGESGQGTWKLEVIDDARGDVGQLNSWSLNLKLKGTDGTTVILEPYQVTDLNGNYSFANLPPGVYNVREYISPDQAALGWRQTWTPPPVTVTSGTDIVNHDFGNWIPSVQTGSIQGQAYYDGNQNGVKDGVDVPQAGWDVYLDLNNNGILDTTSTPTVVTSTDVPKPIHDLATTSSQVFVGSLGTITNVTVTLDISHTFVGDLSAYLVSPSGRQVELFTNVGGQYNDFQNLTLSDSAARSISTIGAADLPYTGTWRPEGSLSDLFGDEANGIWTLVVSDNSTGDEGALNSWSLSFSSSEPVRTTDANGNYQFNNLFAGNYVVRELPKAGWTSIPPADTTIPGAVWNAARWNVAVVATDNPNDPDGIDSKRNVKNVDFGNYAPPGSIAGYVYRDLDANGVKTTGEAGLPGWAVFLDANNNGVLDKGIVDNTVTFDPPTAQVITDATVSPTDPLVSIASLTTSQLYFGSVASIADVDISLDIEHTFDHDLSVFLISPAGTRVALFANVGGSGDNFTGTTFDDSAAVPITEPGLTAPFSDKYRPVDPLSIFNGENAVGYWTLEIKDSAHGDFGKLNSWSLSITGDELSTITDAQGHYSFANLPPTTYHIGAVEQPDWTRSESPAAINLLPGQSVATANFGERPPYLPGDFNSDGFVDSEDFLVWRRQNGQNVPSFSGADGDGSGHVDQADLLFWRMNYGKYRDDHGNNAATATAVSLATSVPGKIELSIDVDWFSFTANAGTEYQIKGTLGTLGAGNLQLFGTNGTTQLATNSGTTPLIDWTAPVDGIYFVQVKGLNSNSVGTYSLNISAVVPDDYGNNAATASAIAAPGSADGQLEVSGDIDWFKLSATAGTAYNLAVQLGTLPYATLRVIGTDGTTTLLSNGGFGPSVHWTAPSTGNFYIEVGSSTLTGSYTLQVAIDDNGNTSGTATPITVPSTTGGNIEVQNDVDWFSFVATSGTSYRFRTTLGTLADSTLTLFGTNGTTQLAFNDDGGGGGLSSQIDWTAPSSGTYFVQVAGLGSASGTYDLAASINGPGSGSSLLLSSAGSGTSLESDSAPLAPAVQPVAFNALSFVPFSQGSAGGLASNCTTLASRSGSQSGNSNDLALLDWLDNASTGNKSAAGESLASDDWSAQASSETDTVDTAFELLEGNALAATTI